jgi:ribosomal protein L37AE/L43A
MGELWKWANDVRHSTVVICVVIVGVVFIWWRRISGILNWLWQALHLRATHELRVQNTKLREENSDLKEKLRQSDRERAEEKIRELKGAQEAERAEAKSFFEWDGYLLKKDQFGGVQNALFCPSCKLPMSVSPGGKGVYACDKCEIIAPWNRAGLENLVLPVAKARLEIKRLVEDGYIPDDFADENDREIARNILEETD